MNPSRYRFLLLASFVAGLFGAIFDTLFRGFLPAALHDMQGAQFRDISPLLFKVYVGIAFVVIATTVISTVGLYRFRPWAPRLALAATAFFLLALPVLGASSMSGPSFGLLTLGAYLWGGVLALTYASDIRHRFRRPGTSRTAKVRRHPGARPPL